MPRDPSVPALPRDAQRPSPALSILLSPEHPPFSSLVVLTLSLGLPGVGMSSIGNILTHSEPSHCPLLNTS